MPRAFVKVGVQDRYGWYTLGFTLTPRVFVKVNIVDTVVDTNLVYDLGSLRCHVPSYS